MDPRIIGAARALGQRRADRGQPIALQHVLVLDQSMMLPALTLATVAVMAPARSEAMKAAVSATSARVGSRLSSVPCSRSAWNWAGVTPAAALAVAKFCSISG